MATQQKQIGVSKTLMREFVWKWLTFAKLHMAKD